MTASNASSHDLSFSKKPDSACEAVIHTMKEDLSSAKAGKGSLSEKPSMQTPASENIFTENIPSKDATHPPKSFPASTSPFLNAAVKSAPQPQTNKAEPFPSKNEPPKESLPPKELSSEKAPLENVPSQKQSRGLKKTILAMISLLTLTAFAGAAYFFLTGSKQEPLEIAPPAQDVTPASQEPPVTVTPLAEKYSSDKPNVLQLDMANASTEAISDLLSRTAQDISSIPSTRPYEFIIADSANNPVAFPIFAIAANLSFDPQLLSLIEEPFSLFLYNESGISKFALAISLKDGAATEKIISSYEKSLPQALLSFFPENISVPAEINFQQSVYGQTRIHYFNLAPEGAYSVDYALIDSKMVIGTSKDSLRAVLDKIITSQPSSPKQESSSLEQ